jgi:hypothetical protein
MVIWLEVILNSINESKNELQCNQIIFYQDPDFLLILIY